MKIGGYPVDALEKYDVEITYDGYQTRLRWKDVSPALALDPIQTLVNARRWFNPNSMGWNATLTYRGLWVRGPN